ncbi:ABC transporter permease subunit [Paenibacillus roseipurpureus]|uniref:ABC transporter permease subunit n=1 Tax=Paenibacillus roseopurpureus TaxID=2918901 RepID=A0AA96LLD9_9BACL|nr:ABC transporter permease subunit [Paenibacillus sp. MBLB1832]WNR43272.1 ABC transporter permease subunit [Paenibacillus sp. MBLB1832]
MNTALYKHMMSIHSKVMMNYAFGSAFYILLMFWLFPSFASNNAALDEMIKSLPEGLTSAFNLGSGFGTVEAFISGEFYGLLLVVIVAIFCILFTTQLMAKLVDQGAMAYLLSVPTTRGAVALTQAAVFVTGLLLIMTVTTLCGFAGYALFIGDLSDFHGGAYLEMNIAAFLLFFAVGGIAFLVSSLANDEKRALGISAVLTFGFFSLDFLGKLSDSIHWLRNLSYFSLYDPSGVIEGKASLSFPWLMLAAIGIVTYAAAIVLFRKRDLPL